MPILPLICQPSRLVICCLYAFHWTGLPWPSTDSRAPKPAQPASRAMKLKTITWRKNISLKGLGSGQALDDSAQDGAFGLFLEEFFPDLSRFALLAIGHSTSPRWAATSWSG